MLGQMEPLGGASGTFEAMLDATEGEIVTLPLSLGRTVVDEACVMQAALDHCRIFLERIEADYGGHVEYEAARTLITATVGALQAPEPREKQRLKRPKQRRCPPTYHA